jgi:hypothetical protein
MRIVERETEKQRKESPKREGDGREREKLLE